MTAPTRIEAARRAACAPEFDGDRTEALESAIRRYFRGSNLEAILADVYRAGFVAGHLDATADQARAEAAARIEKALTETQRPV